MKLNPEQLILDYSTALDAEQQLVALSPALLNRRFFSHEPGNYPVPVPAAAFLKRHGFHDTTIDSLAHAHYRSSTQRGRWSHTDAKRKKDRPIDSPNILLRVFQDWMLHEPLSGIEECISPIAYGIKGRQIPEMIERHCENRYFLKLDIKNAFDSVDPNRLATMLADQSGTPHDQWLSVLDRFACGDSGGLATGSKLSPLLFNVYMAPLDVEFMRIAERDGLTVTRYMDDIVFSSPKPIGKRRGKTIKGLLADKSLVVNQQKVRYHDQEQGRPFLICGMQINPGGGWHIERSALRNIKREIDDLHAALLRDRDLDRHEIGVARGLHGYIKSSLVGAHRSHSSELEKEIIRTFWKIEGLYQYLHPHETQRLRALGRRAI